jgi:hypothetical protein
LITGLIHGRVEAEDLGGESATVKTGQFLLVAGAGRERQESKSLSELKPVRDDNY